MKRSIRFWSPPDISATPYDHEAAVFGQSDLAHETVAEMSGDAVGIQVGDAVDRVVLVGGAGATGRAGDGVEAVGDGHVLHEHAR